VRKLDTNKRAQKFKSFFKARLNRKLTLKELKFIRWLAKLEGIKSKKD
jgi:hypothetical protein